MRSPKRRRAEEAHCRNATTREERTFRRMLVTQFNDKDGSIQNAAAELAELINSFPSVDEALHYLSSHPKTIEIGKAVIAYEILKAERDSRIADLRHMSENVERIDSITDLWLREFFNMVISGHRRDDIESAFENVTLINFNYDRSIEHYLKAALERTARVSQEIADRTVKRIRIIRAYGSLGPLEWQQPDGVPFGAQLEHTDLFEISKRIRTYTEQNAADIKGAINAEIEASRIVVFLGFGFHQQNMELLKVIRFDVIRKVFATVRGINANNYDALSDRLQGVVGASDHEPQLLDTEAYRFLQMLRLSIMMASS
jgi:hypothetical protein